MATDQGKEEKSHKMAEKNELDYTTGVADDPAYRKGDRILSNGRNSP